MQLGVETEPGDIILGILNAHGLKYTDRYQILRFDQRLAHACRAFVIAVEISRIPLIASCFLRSKGKRCIIYDRSRSKTFFQRGGINKRLETRSRLAPRLCNMIELVAAEVESADHRANLAIPRVQRNKRGLDLGK